MAGWCRAHKDAPRGRAGRCAWPDMRRMDPQVPRGGPVGMGNQALGRERPSHRHTRRALPHARAGSSTLLAAISVLRRAKLAV